MFLILSGEGAADIGTKNGEIGPMTKLVDAWIDRQIGYSLIECSFYTIIPKKQLTETAKGIKPRSMKGQNEPLAQPDLKTRAELGDRENKATSAAAIG